MPKFYCVRDKQRYKYSEMARLCGSCNYHGRCNTIDVAEKQGVYCGAERLMGFFSKMVGD